MWYLPSLFFWLPTVQFSRFISGIKCPKCKSKAHVHSYEYKRVIETDNSIGYVIHRRFKCPKEGCETVISSIDPRTLEQLPEEVTEFYPYGHSERSTGVHKSLLSRWAILTRFGTRLGQITKCENELIAQDYSRRQRHYYRVQLAEIEKREREREDKEKKRQRLGIETEEMPIIYVPDVFSERNCPYSNVGGNLTDETTLKLWVDFHKAREPHMQAFVRRSYGSTSRSHDETYKLVKGE